MPKVIFNCTSRQNYNVNYNYYMGEAKSAKKMYMTHKMSVLLAPTIAKNHFLYTKIFNYL